MKKTLSRRKISLLLILSVFISVVLCSCSGNMTDEQAKAELERLLPLSYEMNEIFWGKGLPVQDIDSSDRYLPVDVESGYKTTGEILSKAAKVFSKEYLEQIKDAVFTDGEDTDPRYADINGVLKADTNNKGFNVKGNIVIGSIKIKKQNRNMVIIQAEYEDGGNTDITLIMQDGKWYLNSPTY